MIKNAILGSFDEALFLKVAFFGKLGNDYGNNGWVYSGLLEGQIW